MLRRTGPVVTTNAITRHQLRLGTGGVMAVVDPRAQWTTTTPLLRRWTATATAPHYEALTTHLEVHRSGKPVDKYHYVWLRDNCGCNLCLDPSSQQKKTHQWANPSAIKLTTVQPESNGISINWADGHTSRYDAAWLDANAYSNLESRKYRKEMLHGGKEVLWNASTIPWPSLSIEYDAIMPLVADADKSNATSASATNKNLIDVDKGVYQWLVMLQRYGLCLVKNVPNRDKEVLRVAERMGVIRDTIFGRYFDVQTVENAINVAYTQQVLRPHMDLLYYETPPGFQFLHCLVNDAQGGENTFVDGFKIAHDLRKLDPKAFDTLTEVQHAFTYRNFYQKRHIIELDEDGDISGFNYCPQCDAAPDLPFEQIQPFYDAYARVVQLVNDPKYSLLNKAKPGDVVVFNNRRILHARTAFSGGRRHLQGAYVDRDDFLSRYRMLTRKFDGIAV
eukprot:TRINITY_DN6186_c0_g1_i1.p1 TRINITY_DN6186_c0_g1~~TRINITY_DN6186_c0_g1_i1.p1  ORF type:complete len:449 (-),score=61.59 TRINITY_DN6186_c0_g1_i1:39-1385(-)